MTGFFRSFLLQSSKDNREKSKGYGKDRTRGLTVNVTFRRSKKQGLLRRVGIAGALAVWLEDETGMENQVKGMRNVCRRGQG
jgi:hypothetical protein